MHEVSDLALFSKHATASFKPWLEQQPQCRSFAAGQVEWLEMIRDHIAANLGIEIDDFEYTPVNKVRGLGKVHQLFGTDLPKVLEALNTELVA